jgi:hypothetical protein
VQGVRVGTSGADSAHVRPWGLNRAAAASSGLGAAVTASWMWDGSRGDAHSPHPKLYPVTFTTPPTAGRVAGVAAVSTGWAYPTVAAPADRTAHVPRMKARHPEPTPGGTVHTMRMAEYDSTEALASVHRMVVPEVQLGGEEGVADSGPSTLDSGTLYVPFTREGANPNLQTNQRQGRGHGRQHASWRATQYRATQELGEEALRNEPQMPCPTQGHTFLQR